MTDNEAEENTPPMPEGGADASPQAAEPDRRRTFSFIAVFSLIVLTLLTSYRYAIDTRLNDWYLFHVAKHTAWSLSCVGESAVLEDERRTDVSPREARASMEAWLSGAEAPTPEQIAAAPDTPLSKWESWSYRALRRRHTSETAIAGPHVAYVWKEGIFGKIIDLEYERAKLLESGNQNSPEVRERLTQLSDEISVLHARRTEILKSPEETRKHRDYAFSFIVIPECGAIEIMAIFFAAVVAFPTSVKKKLIGLIAGVPLMYVVNIFRLTCLGVIGALDRTPDQMWFKFSHEYVWQAVYIVFVVIVWLLWVEFVVRRREA